MGGLGGGLADGSFVREHAGRVEDRHHEVHERCDCGHVDIRRTRFDCATGEDAIHDSLKFGGPGGGGLLGGLRARNDGGKVGEDLSIDYGDCVDD